MGQRKDKDACEEFVDRIMAMVEAGLIDDDFVETAITAWIEKYIGPEKLYDEFKKAIELIDQGTGLLEEFFDEFNVR